MTQTNKENLFRQVLKQRFNTVISNLEKAYPSNTDIINKIIRDYGNFPNLENLEFNNIDNPELFKKAKALFEEKFKDLDCESEEFITEYGNLTFKQAFCYSYFKDAQSRCTFCGQLLEQSKKENKSNEEKKQKKLEKYCTAIEQEYVYADIEHILPKSKFPQFTLHPDNFAPACKECNQGEKGDTFFDNTADFNQAIVDLNVDLREKPLKLWKNYIYDFSQLSEIKLKLDKDSKGYKLLEFYGIPKRTDIIISHCYNILFNFIKYSDIRSPESLERLLENMAASNWHEFNDGYSINNSPQIWQEFLEWILYSETNLLALWEEVKDYSVQYSNYCNL